jgi:hypothetical protein
MRGRGMRLRRWTLNTCPALRLEASSAPDFIATLRPRTFIHLDVDCRKPVSVPWCKKRPWKRCPWRHGGHELYSQQHAHVCVGTLSAISAALNATTSDGQSIEGQLAEHLLPPLPPLHARIMKPLAAPPTLHHVVLPLHIPLPALAPLCQPVSFCGEEWRGRISRHEISHPTNNTTIHGPGS